MIPIHNDQEAAHLVATIEQLLDDAGQEATPVAQRDPCEGVGRPQVSISPSVGHPGNQIVVSATNLVRPQAVVWWDRRGQERLAVADVQADCSLTVAVRIPHTAPGEHRLMVQDARGYSARAHITILEPFATPTAVFDP